MYMFHHTIVILGVKDDVMTFPYSNVPGKAQGEMQGQIWIVRRRCVRMHVAQHLITETLRHHVLRV